MRTRMYDKYEYEKIWPTNIRVRTYTRNEEQRFQPAFTKSFGRFFSSYSSNKFRTPAARVDGVGALFISGLRHYHVSIVHLPGFSPAPVFGFD